MPTNLSADRLAHLRALASQFRSAEDAITEAAGLRASLSLPSTTVHVISDVHGEDAKLRHVLNNTSGALRILVDQVLGDRLKPDEKQIFMAVLYYPREAINKYSREIVESGRRLAWVQETLTRQFEIVRVLRARYRRVHFERLLPTWYRELFVELGSAQRPEYIKQMIAGLAVHDRDWGAVRAAARLIRNLAIGELIVAGDLGDRGPRIDRVIDTLMRQPKVSLLWGNHDMIWLGAYLGHEACLLTTLRFSARYRRAAQLEEGYGILTTPLERLVRDVYGDDPAERFTPKGEGHRDPLMVARMQKAIAIMQFKSEGQMLERRPEWNLAHRRLLHRIKFEGTGKSRKAVAIELETPSGIKSYALLDQNLPTIDPQNPYAYSPDEQLCLDRLKSSFTRSMRLREHMDWLVRRGSMWTRRDDVLLFHGCVPVDEAGHPLSLMVDGKERSGRELMDALGSVVRRAFRKRWFAMDEDGDWLWYLWGGPRSPLFGKDKLATFETYFLAEKETHKEHKNAYFDLIHDAGFVRNIGRLFGCGEDVLIVNGHVPVKIEKGEHPVKKGGNAITIDGAFSEAYGDRGYTLVLKPDRIDLAEHAKFDGIDATITRGADMVPKIETIRTYQKPRTARDTEEGAHIERSIADLDALVQAYYEGLITQEA
ncbi:MAG: fructose-bisphosphatase class III [Phycisphaerales bacterium]